MLHVLARRGEDCSGRLIAGAGSLRRHRQQRLQARAPGRRPLLSLRALNGHLLGLPSQDWRVHAAQPAARRLIDTDTVDAVTRLWWFGRLIANSDMHLGKLGFHPLAWHLRLAPAYDMRPMAFTPLPGGEVPEPRWNFELPLPGERAAWQAACAAALAFWADAAIDACISPGSRARAAVLEQRLITVRDRA